MPKIGGLYILQVLEKSGELNEVKFNKEFNNIPDGEIKIYMRDAYRSIGIRIGAEIMASNYRMELVSENTKLKQEIIDLKEQQKNLPLTGDEPIQKMMATEMNLKTGDFDEESFNKWVHLSINLYKIHLRTAYRHLSQEIKWRLIEENMSEGIPVKGINKCPECGTTLVRLVDIDTDVKTIGCPKDDCGWLIPPKKP